MEFDRVVLKSSKSIHDEQFDLIVFANPGMTEKWRKDKSIPLVDVIQRFEIFDADTKGLQGKVNRVSKQRIHDAVGTENIDDAIRLILEKGDIKHHSKYI
jgi:ribosome maturation protein Sdo1